MPASHIAFRRPTQLSSIIPKAILILINVSIWGRTLAFSHPPFPLPHYFEGHQDLVDLSQLSNHILIHLIYSTPHNVFKEDIYGDLETCYLRRETAEKLLVAQQILDTRKRGFRLIVYDGLRPRTAQYYMWRAVKNTPLSRYVANPEQGSLHNYGVAVDVSIVDESGNLLDMGTPFDFFGDLAQPRYEERFFKEGLLSETQINNRKLLREVMEEAGFQGVEDEWWHFNLFSLEEAKRRYTMVEFIIPLSEAQAVIAAARGLYRDSQGFCILIQGTEKKLYLLEGDSIKFVFDIATGKGGLGKTREGDGKTPLGDYRIKWMVSRKGPPKQNPQGESSFVIDGNTYAVLDTQLYFGNLEKIRVKTLPDGTRIVSSDEYDRPISAEELRIAQDEKLWTDAYGGEEVYVMALNYPNPQDRLAGKTGSCIEIHASRHLEQAGLKAYQGTLGCIAMYPEDARKVYTCVNPGTPVRIVK